jgi:gamma-carbonic anhydrase
VDPSAYIDVHALVLGDVIVGPEASIWARVILKSDVGQIQIGAGTCVLDGTLIESGRGTWIGRDCVIGPSAKLAGVQLEDATLVGAGAILPEGSCVKTGGRVAAGAVLTAGMVVPAGFEARGRPARLAAIEAVVHCIRNEASKYREMSAHYRVRRDPRA